MATLDAEDRKELENSEFAYIDKDGERHLPIHDDDHARNAVARFGQTDFESKDAKHKAAKKHGIDVSDDTDVAKAAKG